jgi:hypothetical protein
MSHFPLTPVKQAYSPEDCATNITEKPQLVKPELTQAITKLLRFFRLRIEGKKCIFMYAQGYPLSLEKEKRSLCSFQVNEKNSSKT